MSLAVQRRRARGPWRARPTIRDRRASDHHDAVGVAGRAGRLLHWGHALAGLPCLSLLRPITRACRCGVRVGTREPFFQLTRPGRPGRASRSQWHTRASERAEDRLHEPVPLRDVAGARRTATCARHQRPRRADLPDDVVHLQRLGPWRPAVRVAGVRQHLHADHESDDRRLRAAHCRARGRRGGPGDGQRAGGAVPRHLDHCPGRRQHRLDQLPLRRHLQPVQGHAAAAWHRREVRRRRQRRRLRETDRRQDQGTLRRVDRQPPVQRARPGGARETGARQRHSAHRRQHVRLRRLHLPPDRPRRRHRRRLGHQVDRRSWHVHRRRHRRCGQVRLGLGQVPALHRAGARIPRPRVHGAVRRQRPVRQHRVHHPCARRGPARHRRVA